MPTYDYKCKACGHTWEMFQSMSAKPVKACPECGRKTAERLIGTGAALLFKGSGFYETDYRSDSYKKSAEADKKASTGGESSGSDGKPADKKTDAKPAAATETAKPKADAKPAPKPKKKGGE